MGPPQGKRARELLRRAHPGPGPHRNPTPGIQNPSHRTRRKAHGLVHHSTEGLRVVKKKKRLGVTDLTFWALRREGVRRNDENLAEIAGWSTKISSLAICPRPTSLLTPLKRISKRVKQIFEMVNPIYLNFSINPIDTCIEKSRQNLSTL